MRLEDRARARWLVEERRAEQAGGSADGTGGEQGEYDAATQHEQGDGGGGEHDVLPVSLRAAASGIAEPMIAPAAAGAAPARKTITRSFQQTLKRAAPIRMNENDGANATSAASSAAGRPPAA